MPGESTTAPFAKAMCAVLIQPVIPHAQMPGVLYVAHSKGLGWIGSC